MKTVAAEQPMKDLQYVWAYAEQLSKVFYSHAYMDGSATPVKKHMTVLGATLASVKQVLSLLKEEAEGDGKQIFSLEGLEFANLLAAECAKNLAKIALAIADATVKRSSQLKRKPHKKAKPDIVVVPTELKLDESDALKNLENAKWYRVKEETDDYIDRLHQIHSRLFLLYQVVTLGALSRNVSTDGIDVQTIVRYHERIKRTAKYVVIIPTCHTRNSHRRLSLSSLNGSSSDSDSYVPRHPASSPSRSRPSFPPPSATGGPPPPLSGERPPPPPGVPKPPSSSGPLPPVSNSHALSSVKPPSYESHNITNIPLQQKKNLVSRDQADKVTASLGAKAPSRNLPIEAEVGKPVAYKKASEERLFESQHNRLGFKLKSLFRSKASLAAEMKRVLDGTHCVLRAFIIQRKHFTPIPHSTFHDLEATHLRTILGQLNDDSWFKIFSMLTNDEHDTLDCVISRARGRTQAAPKAGSGEVVVLKILEQNKYNAWMRLLTNCLGASNSFPHHENERIILAILREQSGKRGQAMPVGGGLYQPPFGVVHSSPPVPHLPPPPRMRPNKLRNYVSDLSHAPLPPPPPSLGPSGYPMALQQLPQSPHTSHSQSALPAIDIPGNRYLITDSKAMAALTTYSEFSLRPVGPVDGARSWFRVTVTEESNPDHQVISRVNTFNSRGGNIIVAKLRLTEEQAWQMTRLMDKLYFNETDNRFSWCWVEISLYNGSGEIINHCQNGTNEAGKATVMHLIAKRFLKAENNPSQAYCAMTNRLQPPAPALRPPLPMPRPPMPMPGPPAHVVIRRRGSMRPESSSDSESSDTGTDYSSARGYRMTRRRRRRSQRDYNDSDSDDSDDEDVLKIHLVIKKGDDVVKKLLDLWTPSSEEKEK